MEAIQSVGEEFNPELHEAVDTEETDSEMDGKVIEEYSRGFRMGDRLLRPARVKVGRARASPTGDRVAEQILHIVSIRRDKSAGKRTEV